MRDSASIVQPVTPPIIIANASWVDSGGPKYIIRSGGKKRKTNMEIEQKKENGYITTPL